MRAQASTVPSGAGHGKTVLVSVTSAPRTSLGGKLVLKAPPYPSNGMNSGPPVAVGPFYGYACTVLDPTCGSDQTWTYQVQQAVPQAQLSNINSIYANITH